MRLASSRRTKEWTRDRYVTEPGLKPPDMPHSLDDEFDYQDGTAATSVGWTNGVGSDSKEMLGGRLVMVQTNTSNNQGIVKSTSALSGDFTWTTRLNIAPLDNYFGAGLCAVWGTPGSWTDVKCFRMYVSGGGSRINRSDYSGSWAWESSQADHSMPFGHPVYLQLKWNNTSSAVEAYWSKGGYRWASYGSWTSLTKPPYIGFMTTDGSTYYALFDFFRVNWTPDF